MQGDGQLNDTEIRSKVTARGRHLGDQEFANLTGKDGQLLGRQRSNISRIADARQQTHFVIL